MKTELLQFTVFLLVIAGSFSSCGKNNDIDMSKIDFSNIENLYEQPLPVIQKCVEGKWQWLWTSAGVITSRPINTVINITEEKIVISGTDAFDKAFSYSWDYRWEKKEIYPNYETYVMWYNEQNEAAAWYFDCIKNDTLGVFGYRQNELSVWCKIK